MEQKIVKTADGHGVEVNKYYYNSNGEQVFLNEVLVNQAGAARFLVTPTYEGTAMEVSGAGGYHHEIIVPYIHEAMPVVISAIYKDEPVPLIGQAYAEKIKTLARIAEAVGELVIREKELKVNLRKMAEAEKEKSKQIDELDKQIEDKNELLANKMAQLTEIDDDLKITAQRLSEKSEQLADTEQILSKLKNSAPPEQQNRGSFVLVNREEIATLRKAAFKL